MTWQDHAACQGKGAEHFVFSESSHGLTRATLEAIGAAKAICSLCVVKAPCLDYALNLGERFGVWGGEYLSQRRAAELRRRRRTDAA